MILSWINSNIVFPVYHMLKRDGLWTIIRNYEKSQYYSSDTLKAIRKNKLGLILQHCYKNVYYYRNLFNSLGLGAKDLSDYTVFQKIPFLTKKIISNNIEQLISKKNDKRDLVANSTSGSTGWTG